MDRPVDQPVDQHVDQPVDRHVDQPVDRPVDRHVVVNQLLFKPCNRTNLSTSENITSCTHN